MSVLFWPGLRRFFAGMWVTAGLDAAPPATDSTVRLRGLSIVSQWVDPGPEDPPADPRIPVGWVALMDENFNSGWSTADNANPTAALWNSKMSMGTGVAGGSVSNLQDVTLLNKGGGDRCLRFKLPKDYTDKGTTMWANIPGTHDEAIFEYSLRFSDFLPYWGWGGKLPGLGGVAPGTSVGYPSGGQYGGSLGWSGRMMWIGKDSTGDSPYDSHVVSPRKNIGLFYNYGFDQIEKSSPTAYGDNDWFNTPAGVDTFKSNQWHKVRIHYRLNTVGQANGFLQIKLDGVVVKERTAWRPRNATNVHITQVWWHIFRGGNTADWGVATDEYVDIDDVLVAVPA